MKPRVINTYWALMGLLFASQAHAISLGGGDSGIFAPIGRFFQSVTDFLGGTGAMFIVFLSFCGAIGMWVLMPKQAGAAIAWAFRATVGGILLFGMGMLVTWVRTF